MSHGRLFRVGNWRMHRARRARRAAAGHSRQLLYEHLEDRRVLSFGLPELAAPLVDAGPNVNAVEGSAFTSAGSVNDVDSQSWSATVNYGDGSGSQPLTIDPAGTFELSHIYPDNGVYAVTVSVADEAQTVGVDTMQVTVGNAVPGLYVCGRRTVVEGTLLEIRDIGMFTDAGFTSAAAGTTETFTYSINWGDGSAADSGSATVDLPGGPGVLTRGTFDGAHTYANDGQYTVSLVVRDDDNGVSATRLVTVKVTNAAPVIAGLSLDPEVITETESVVLTGSFTDRGILDTHTVVIVWGDGQTSDAVVDSATKTFTAQHQYMDRPSGTLPQYTIDVTVTDDAGATDTETVVVTVNAAPPVAEAGADQSADEGQPVTFAGTFTDLTVDDTHVIEWDFGDGTTDTGSLTPSHAYGDNGTYTVTLTVTDSDQQSSTDTLTVTVANVAPTLTVPGAQTVAEGALLDLTEIGRFTDPGFTRASAATSETFTFSVDWGDGTAPTTGSVTSVEQGDTGRLTSGVFGSSHAYADDGVYTVTVTVTDDDGGEDQQTFAVTVTNVAPTLTVAANQTVNEGAMLIVTDIGVLTDPGFANPSNPGTERQETFTYRINWGDGTADSTGLATIDRVGSNGTLTSASFDGSHTYADNGTYAVMVTVTDDNGGTANQSLQVTVSNVAPTLGVIGNQSATVGVPLNLTDVGVFTDPGFANGLNTGGEVDETFTFSIDWGDDSPPSSGNATIDQAGATGVLTAGSFDGSHTYSVAGTYAVTVRVTDDDGGSHEQDFDVVVTDAAEGQSESAADQANRLVLTADTLPAGGTDSPVVAHETNDEQDGDEQDGDEQANDTEENGNQPPTVWGPGNLEIDEGAFSMPPLGYFLDGDSSGPFSYAINWGDGTASATGTAAIEVPGPPSAGSFDASHVYGDDGVFDLALAVTDEQGATTTEIFEVTVNNVLPQLADAVITTPISEGGTATLTGTIIDPGTGDSHELVVVWGDGTTDTYLYGAGATSFRETHRYGNNQPQDAPLTVQLALTDDDAPDEPATAELSIVVRNMPPVAVDDVYVHIGGGDLVVDAELGVLANDSDPGDDLVTVHEYGTPSAGTLVGNADGSFVYTPPSDDFSGVVRFTYTAVDSDGAVSARAATVTIDSALRGSVSGTVTIPFATTSFEFTSVGIPGVTITLTENTSQGVVRTTTLTGDDGSYYFGGLRVGTYTVTETQPAALNPGGTDTRQVTIDGDVPRTGVDFVDGWFRSYTPSLRNYFASSSSLAALLTPTNIRDMIARGEQQAGNTDQAAAILAGGSQTTVFVTGTASDDNIEFLAGPTHHKLFVNNFPFIFNATEVESFRINGGGGRDTMSLVGSASADVISLRPVPGSSWLQLPDYTLRGIDYLVTIDGVENVTAQGGGGYDRAYLYDSPGNDLLELNGESARLSSWGTDTYALEVIAFDWVRASGTAGGLNAQLLTSAIDFALETEGQWTE